MPFYKMKNPPRYWRFRFRRKHVANARDFKSQPSARAREYKQQNAVSDYLVQFPLQ